ncbi:carbonic anhydrase [candidate division LCP-89 bacterium B3_LCP]|uniref:Carbonic anhydrase n=1 Tax=candidate division LCP-89 bacterium B3_LCP TaxID=2012998 RepID=A0A532UPG0_UNCL8|nr:MAG: carbonic anhydrase [candidate division LCP-89 bacterium B3_LCP]
MNADEALKSLKKGNTRFTQNNLTHPNQTEARRREVVSGQEPFAIVLTCSDSRTPPEIIFDRGIGDLFIVRTAGNVTDDVAVGSMEIAVEEFGVQLIMVLGHENCGAIKFAISESDFKGHIGSVMDKIKPVIEEAKKQPGNLQDNVAKENVKLVVEKLRNSQPILTKFISEGKLKIIGGYYRLENGEVEIITE